MPSLTRPLDRRIEHLEQVVNARSEEQVAALEKIAEQVQAVAESHRQLADNLLQVIETHLEFHAESMAALGAMFAEARAIEARAAVPADSNAAADAPTSG